MAFLPASGSGPLLRFVGKERDWQAYKERVADDAVQQRGRCDAAGSDCPQRQNYQIHHSPHRSAIQQTEDHPMRTQCRDAAACEEVDRRKNKRDGEVDEDAETSSCKSPAERLRAQQTAGDVLNWLATLCRQYSQVNEDGYGHDVKEHMQRIRADTVALGQKGMSLCVHGLIASDLL